LKKVLARQPGPEVAEQINVYQQSLKEKTAQLKAMASELNMYQAQINEYKFEISRMNDEMTDVKRKFFAKEKQKRLDVKDEIKKQQPTDKHQKNATDLLKNLLPPLIGTSSSLE